MYTWILVFLKNRNIISKMKRSKVTDYAALTLYIVGLHFLFKFVQIKCRMSSFIFHYAGYNLGATHFRGCK